MSTGPAKSTLIRFATFEFEPTTGELRKQGMLIKLAGQPISILALLLNRPGELVTREEIQKQLWPADTFVDFEHSVNAAMKRLRAALNDSPNAPRYIETFAGRGYRFIAPVNGALALSDASAAVGVEIESGSKPSSRSHQWWLWPSIAVLMLAVTLAGWSWRGSLRRIVSPNRSPAIRSLAVLPLENLTGDASQEYFSDGMTDALITDLAQIGTLRVISRTSIMRYKGLRKPLPEIARELGVEGIVEGTVTRSAGRVRITSQLIYAPADQHLWAHSYEHDLGDAVTLQSEVAEAIAREVRAVLTPEQRSRLSARVTTSPDAYEAYLKGRYYWNQRTPAGVEKSVAFFQQAVEKDPNFALAYAGLADAHNFSNILGVVAPKESSPKAEAAAASALALDPQLGEAHAALGLVKSHYDFDFPAAQKEFLKAIELNPNYTNAHLFYAGAYLTPMGQHKEAVAQMKKALELDPLSVPLNNMMGQTYLWAGDNEKSLQQFQHTIELDPTFPLAHFFFSGLLTELGRYEEAIKENERGELVLGASSREAGAVATQFRKAFQSHGAQGYWQKNLDLTLKAHKQAGTRYFAAIALAGAYARAGDKENALKWLEKSYEDREGQTITLIRWLPDFNSLHADPRFANLLRRMGLPH